MGSHEGGRGGKRGRERGILGLASVKGRGRWRGDVQPAGAGERLYPAQSAGQHTQRTGVKSHIVLPVNT